MKVQLRIQQAPACEVINLDEDEKDIYSGAGWKIARFDNNGHLAGFFDPMLVMWRESERETAKEAVDSAIAWLANAEGECWLVMCSNYQLCEPRQIRLDDAIGLARMARVFTEQILGL